MHATQIKQQHLCLKFCRCFGFPKSRAILKGDELDENDHLSYNDEKDTSEYIRSILSFCQRAAEQLRIAQLLLTQETWTCRYAEKGIDSQKQPIARQIHATISITAPPTSGPKMAGWTYRMANIISPRRMSNFMFFSPFLSAFLRWPDIKSSAFAESPRGWSLLGMVTGRTWADVQLEGMMRWSVRRYQGPEHRKSKVSQIKSASSCIEYSQHSGRKHLKCSTC